MIIPVLIALIAGPNPFKKKPVPLENKEQQDYLETYRARLQVELKLVEQKLEGYKFHGGIFDEAKDSKGWTGHGCDR